MRLLAVPCRDVKTFSYSIHRRHASSVASRAPESVWVNTSLAAVLRLLMQDALS